jgi:hypothetical protein
MTQQIALDILAPPVLVGMWWLMSRGWAIIAQGGKPSARTKIWTNKGTWVLLVVLYCLAFGITLYGYFARNSQ